MYEPVGVAALQCLLISSKATAVATLMYNKKVGKRGLPSPSQNSIESLVVVVVVIEQQQHTLYKHFTCRRQEAINSSSNTSTNTLTLFLYKSD